MKKSTSRLDKIQGSHLLEQIGSAQTTPLALKDLGYRFVYVNEAFANAIGQKSADLIGKNDLELGRPEKLVLGDPETGWIGLWPLDDIVTRTSANGAYRAKHQKGLFALNWCFLS